MAGFIDNLLAGIDAPETETASNTNVVTESVQTAPEPQETGDRDISSSIYGEEFMRRYGGR